MFDTILVLDFGSQYSHLITRRLREFNIYAEMLPCTQKISELGWTPKGVILSGGPYSVYAEDAPHVDHAIFDLNVPILGICYGMQELAWINGKQVGRGDKRVRSCHLKVIDDSNSLFKGMNDSTVWMSHGDKLHGLPTGYKTIATSDNSPYCGIVHETKPIYGIQFHPELAHSHPKNQKTVGPTAEVIGAREAEKIKPKDGKEIQFLLQGTLYPDVIESISFKGPSQTIKTHHNVGGLLENMKLKLIEPLRELFKDEVRHLGELLESLMI
nr:BPK_HP1_G0043760.mRNA.1.CDS.1 [Saccharomyces cerevisiae]